MKFEENKIYNIINGKNLKMLIRYSCMKKKKLKVFLGFKENEGVEVDQKISKNWRSRKKNH
jgi:mannose/fructose-specific phosphotransferase system component IIA